MSYLVALDTHPAPAVELVGGKFASLCQLQADHRIPPAVCIVATAYREWQNTGSLPDSLRDEIIASGLLEKVAVRSSGIDEDGDTSSQAGKYRSMLNVSGINNIITAIADCWKSNPGLHAMGVIIQETIPAKFAGVAFSLQPVTGDRDVIVIEATTGLGDGIASGTAIPESYEIRKQDLTIVTSPRQASLRADHIHSVASLARRLETETSRPVDLEWAIADNSLFLLQCRPVTGLDRD